jgi:aminocarboxymuconate-semialdehyde decarboxylase
VKEKMIIDFHNHFFPREYLKALENQSGYPRVRTDTKGNVYMSQAPEMEIPLARTAFDVKKRIEEMDAVGVDANVVSVTVPGVERLKSTQEAVKRSRLINNAFSDMVSKYDGRIAALATLPLQDVTASLEEMDRAISKLHLNGIMVFTNVKGKSLAAKEFWPILARAEKLGAPVLMHPTIPPAIDGLTEFDMVESEGFLFDSTMTLTKMILSGLFDQHRDLKLVGSHLGGALPFIIGRLDMQFSWTPEMKKFVKEPPSYYLKQIYFDTTTNMPLSVEFTYKLLGSQKLLLGSDYPIWPLRKGVENVKNAHIPEKDKARILSNGEKLLLNYG